MNYALKYIYLNDVDNQIIYYDNLRAIIDDFKSEVERTVATWFGVEIIGYHPVLALELVDIEYSEVIFSFKNQQLST